MPVVAFALVAAACTGNEAEPGATPPATTQVGATTTTSAPATSTAGTAATTSAAVPEPKPYGGTLSYFASWLGMGQSLNPYLLVDGDVVPTAAEVAGRAHLGGVWSFNADTGALVPDLVTVLPSLDNGGLVLNEDGTLTVRYEIDPDAVWSDGVPISGNDFAFTYEVVTETTARLEEAAADDTTDDEFFETCGHQEPIGVLGADVFAAIDPGSISAGAKSFEYTLIDPGAYGSGLFRYVVPRHAVEGTDFLNGWHDRMWPSAGPFVVGSWDTESRELTVVRNDNYWRTDPETGQQLPYLDSLVFTGFENEFRKLYPSITDFHQAFMECRDIFAALDRIGVDPGGSEAQDLFATGGAAFEGFEGALFVDGVVIDLLLSGVGNDQVAELDSQGVEFRDIPSVFWEHIAFHYGDARLRANDDSLVEHLGFRRAIAHALDRRRIAEETNGIPIGSLVEVYSPTLSGVGWDRYDYDPDEARRLLGELCARLNRDCDADPPRLVFTHRDSPDRDTIGRLLDEMLSAVGIEVDVVEQDSTEMTYFEGCSGWESSTWTWAIGNGLIFDALPIMFSVFDPAGSANPVADGDGGVPTGARVFGVEGANLYAWGTDAVTDAVDLDDPFNDTCDETTVYNQGPSSVRDPFTRRFDDLLREAEEVADPAEYRPLVLEMEEILADQAVIIPLYARTNALAVRDDLVGGYRYQAAGATGAALWNVGEWYLVDG